MKHHKLMRALRTGTRELKPNAEIRDLLNVHIISIVSYWLGLL